MTATVSAEDFRLILEQVRDFIRTRVVPREQEIADNGYIATFWPAAQSTVTINI